MTLVSRVPEPSVPKPSGCLLPAGNSSSADDSLRTSPASVFGSHVSDGTPALGHRRALAFADDRWRDCLARRRNQSIQPWGAPPAA